MDGALAAIDCHAASSAILAWLGRALLLGTTLAGLTWLVTRLWRRRGHPGLEAALWLIVLIKFLAPVGPESSLSLATVVDTLYRRVPVHSAAVVGSVGADINDPDPALDAGTSGAAPSAAVAAPTTTTVTQPGQRARPVLTTARPQWRWTTLLTGAYLAGVLTLFVLRTRSYRALLGRCRGLPPADESTRTVVVEVCRRLRVRRIPTVWTSDDCHAPLVAGLFRPWLVLPRRLPVRPDELETVLVHEVAHLRRGDLFVRHLQWIAGTLLFFWPVVAWVNRRIDVARECACDQWALRHGKLAAGEYARCLLHAIQAIQLDRHPSRSSRWLACQPACMAGNHTTFERRIDMILESPSRRPRRPVWGLMTFAFLLAWGGFTLAGAAADPSPDVNQQNWPATAEALQEHAIQLYNLVAQRGAADLNGDGRLSYREKSTYLVGLAMRAPQAFIEEFPYADRDHNQTLDYWEAYDAIRGITLIAYADRRSTAAPGAVLDLEFYHMALDAQEWLLDNVTAEPSAADVANARAFVNVSYNPRAGHARTLDHGAPKGTGKPPGRSAGEAARFKELEGSIASIEARLAAATDAGQIAKLKLMRDKLEAILARLQAD